MSRKLRWTPATRNYRAELNAGQVQCPQADAVQHPLHVMNDAEDVPDAPNGAPTSTGPQPSQDEELDDPLLDDPLNDKPTKGYHQTAFNTTTIKSKGETTMLRKKVRSVKMRFAVTAFMRPL